MIASRLRLAVPIHAKLAKPTKPAAPVEPSVRRLDAAAQRLREEDDARRAGSVAPPTRQWR